MNMFTSNQFLSIEHDTFMNLYKNQIDTKALGQIFQKKAEYIE